MNQAVECGGVPRAKHFNLLLVKGHFGKAIYHKALSSLQTNPQKLYYYYYYYYYYYKLKAASLLTYQSSKPSI